MAIITGTVTLDSTPLTRTFIGLGVPFGSLGFFIRVADIAITDGNGKFSFITSLISAPVGKLNIFIYCHNSVIKIIQKINEIRTPVSVKESFKNGGTIDITKANFPETYDYFRMLERSRDVYDTCWKQFKPYYNMDRGDFPLGRLTSERETFANSNFIELVYPDDSLAGLSWTEPSGISTSYPSLHIKDKTTDGRLFGDAGYSPSIIPHELGHAFHFASLDNLNRITIEAQYFLFLVTHFYHPYHGTTLSTSPFVAFIEAIGIFSERFYFFSKLIRPDLSGINLQNAFVNDELSIQSLSSVLTQYTNIGTVDPADNVTAPFHPKKDIEGSVYGALLHLAKKIGLLETIDLVFKSKATTFDELKNYVLVNSPSSYRVAIKVIEKAWFV
jgi:hypothetical protein